MMAGGRWRVGLAAAVAACWLAGCGGPPGPEEPTPSATTTSSVPTPANPATTAGPATTPSPATSPSVPTTTAASSPPSQSTSRSGLTLRQLGFENGPLDEFSLPSDSVIATSVDQPNTVTIVLARPSPEAVEGYLRATLPAEGFTIDDRAAAGQALRFDVNGWTGGFTGTGATSAIVLRPA